MLDLPVVCQLLAALHHWAAQHHCSQDGSHRGAVVRYKMDATDGYYEGCQGILKPYRQMGNMAKDSLLSALCLSVLPGRVWYPGPLAGTISKRYMEKTASSLSPYTVLWQYLNKLCSFEHPHMPLFCAQHVISTLHFRLWLCRALAQTSHYFKHFELQIRCRINNNSRTPHRAREDKGQVFYSMDTVLPQPSCSAGQVWVLPPVLMAPLLWNSASRGKVGSLKTLPFLGETTGRCGG